MSEDFIYTGYTKFRFGKYKGWTVHEVMAVNPSYLVWCARNIEWFHLDLEILSEAEDMYTEQAIRKVSRPRFFAGNVPQDPEDCPYWFEDDNGSWLS